MSPAPAFLDRLEELLPLQMPGVAARTIYAKILLYSPSHTKQGLYALVAAGRARSFLSQTQQGLPLRLYRRADPPAMETAP